MGERRDPLLTPAFLELCLFNFAASAAVFALLPVAPFHIRDLGGPPEAAGFFLGGLTFASAATAPWTGAVGDALGQGRVLTASAAGIALLFGLYALLPTWELFVAGALLQGLLWSAVLTSSGAYAMRLIPPERRAEGIAVHGMATLLAISVAPTAGFALYALGWRALALTLAGVNLAIAVLAVRFARAEPPARRDLLAAVRGHGVAWPVLRFALGIFLVAFGYGGLTSFVALFCEARAIAPKGIYFVAFAGTMLALRPFVGRLVDRVGPFRTFAPSLVLVALALLVLPFATQREGIVAGAMLYGAGFATVGPAFTSYVITRVPAERRGAAFGANIAAFDSGIGSGSIAFGPLVTHLGYRWTFWIAAALTLAAWPYFKLARARFERATAD